MGHVRYPHRRLSRDAGDEQALCVGAGRATILELEAGKIRRESDYWDAATFMQQVGLLSSRPGTP